MFSPARQESAETPARVAIVDADRRVQQSIAEVLRVAGVEVIGTAGDVRSAMELVETAHPTVLVVDPRLPDIDAGRALLSGIALGWPSVRVVLMGWTDEPDGLPAGAAFVSKSAQPEEFVAATVAACNC
ncbi:MAG TPA: response regulator [Candidatus Limnocylindria bacterium]|nr:response regulator [Candidatus Limnocylindria bacterium]